jgi:cyclophilin family peptidyl-prolyl cis-trans isomerase
MTSLTRALRQPSSQGVRQILLKHEQFSLEVSRRWMGTGSRGARGHGWYVKYRGVVPPPAAASGKAAAGPSASKDPSRRKKNDRAAIEKEAFHEETPIASRHLLHEYVEGRMSQENAARWNEAVLSLGSTPVYFDLVLSHHQHGPEESHRVVVDLASTVMPDATGKFIDLLPNYHGTKLGRYEKNVAWCGGASLLTPAPGEVELPDPRPLWHLPGTVSMVQRDCLNGQFLMLTHEAPHLDGIHMAIGTARDVKPLQKWASTLLTMKGVPTAYDIIVQDAGVLSGDVRGNGE